MNTFRIIRKEMTHSAVNTALGVIAVLAASACVTASLTTIELHDRRTEEIVERKKVETETRVAKMEDDYRKIMKSMGFNVLILPKDQNLADFYSDSFAAKDMPEEYVHRLANSSVVTVRHLLPSLQMKIEWPEQNRKIILMGIQHEVPIAERGKMPDILDAVPPGEIVVGHEIHSSLGLKIGQAASILGREFKVHKLHVERGTKDDITIFMNLKEAQELLGKPGRINGIHALECGCAWADIGKVRTEISKTLPDTKIIEIDAGKALARAEARRRAAVEAEQAVDAVIRQRNELRLEREAFAARLIPVVVLISGLWLALLTFSNVKDRQYEIALLRSLGLSAWGVMKILLTKAILVGAAGAVIGVFVGIVAGLFGLIKDGSLDAAQFGSFVHYPVVLIIVAAASLLAGVAAWPPALYGCQKDPAVLLAQE